MLAGVSPSNAVSPLPIFCNLQAILHVTPGEGTGPQQWSIGMAGDCSGDLEGPYFATGGGQGTSTGSGFCGGLVVRDLLIDVQLSLQSLKAPQFNKFLFEQWSAPVTTWPIATPFGIAGLVDRTGNRPTTNSFGAGVIFNRLRGPLGGCPGPESSPAAVTLTIRTT
jgi:hypothetical protein